MANERIGKADTDALLVAINRLFSQKCWKKL